MKPWRLWGWQEAIFIPVALFIAWWAIFGPSKKLPSGQVVQQTTEQRAVCQKRANYCDGITPLGSKELQECESYVATACWLEQLDKETK
jgi:hypothetical protein